MCREGLARARDCTPACPPTPPPDCLPPPRATACAPCGRGEGVVEVAYLDSDLRIFRAPNGSLSVQVRQDRLPALLGWPAR